MANSITTLKAREKFAKAHAEGITVPKITSVGWGEGGADTEGNVIAPTNRQTEVDGQFLVNDIKEVSYPLEGEGNYLTVRFKATINYSESGALDKRISTCGLYDEEGDLIAIKNFSPKSLDEDTRIEIEWDEEF